ncbi:hypothetical protein BCO26_0327 [Heyndrickxia coagulans 2-6]|nr:hypothetical protein BCO26_0327 [Heyndrickxia coagulans 2-6]
MSESCVGEQLFPMHQLFSRIKRQADVFRHFMFHVHFNALRRQGIDNFNKTLEIDKCIILHINVKIGFECLTQQFNTLFLILQIAKIVGCVNFIVSIPRNFGINVTHNRNELHLVILRVILGNHDGIGS